MSIDRNDLVDVTKALVRASPMSNIVMCMSVAFEREPLVDCGISKEVDAWAWTDLMLYLDRVQNMVGSSVFVKALYKTVKPGGLLSCPAAETIVWKYASLIAVDWAPMRRRPKTVIATEENLAAMQKEYVASVVAKNGSVALSRWTNKVDSWTVYFAEFAKSDIAKDRMYAVTALTLAHERLYGLGIFRRVVAMLLATKNDYAPDTLTIDKLLDKFPFAAPFVHACLTLENVQTEWRSSNDGSSSLLRDAYRHILENVPVHQLVGCSGRDELAQYVATRDSLKHRLVNYIVTTSPTFVSNRGTLYANIDLILSYFDRGVDTDVHVRRRAFLQMMVDDGALDRVFYVSPEAMEDEYHAEAAQRATTVHVHAPAGDWIDATVRSIGLDNDDALLLQTFLRKNKVEQTQLRHLPLTKFEAIGLAWGPAYKIYTAFQTK